MNARPNVGHLQLFQNKMTNVRGGRARLELTEPLFFFCRNFDRFTSKFRSREL